jgi:glycosyltransferase involved in cell wall biosynthesis
MDHDRVFVVMPAFNEAPAIEAAIQEVAASGYRRIIVVDDGSDDDTYERARAMGGVIALRHMLNRGKGAAVKTGIEAAKMLGAAAVVTIDADGQHNPAAIAGMLALIDQGYDVVLGSRLKNPKGMPFHKVAANLAGNGVTWMLYGLWVTDSQSGLRAYSKRAVDLIDARTDRYEYDTEVIREIKRHRLKFVEVPIDVRYTAYSMSKRHKMNLVNGVKILIKLLISGS